MMFSEKLRGLIKPSYGSDARRCEVFGITNSRSPEEAAEDARQETIRDMIMEQYHDNEDKWEDD